MNWFLCVEGETVGPITEAALEADIRSGRLTPLSLAYDQELKAWRLLSEIERFRPLFGSPERRAKTGWIVLREEAGSSTEEPTMDGPFDSDEVMDRLATGEIRYSQFAWRPGMGEWQRIGDCEDLDRRRRRKDGLAHAFHESPARTLIEDALKDLASVRNETPEELLSAVVRVEKKLASEAAPLAPLAEEPPPAGTDGVDLVEEAKPSLKGWISALALAAILAPALAFAQKKPVPTAPPPASVPQSATNDGFTSDALQAHDSAEKQLQELEDDYVDAATAKEPKATGTPYVPPQVIHNSKATDVDKIAKELSLSDGKPDKKKPEAKPSGGPEGPDEKPAAAKAPVDTGPKPIEITLKSGATKPSLVFQFQGIPTQNLSVTITGQSGRILRLASYRRAFEVKKKAGEAPALDLVPLKLPAGFYDVDVFAGEVHVMKTVFIGTRDAQFDSELERHLKTLAHQQQLEKKTLFYTAKEFEDLARELDESVGKLGKSQGKWKSFYGDWTRKVRKARQPVVMILASPKYTLAYPEELKAFKSAIDRLGDRGRDLDRAVNQQRELASVLPTPSQKEFTQIRQAASQLQARP